MCTEHTDILIIDPPSQGRQHKIQPSIIIQHIEDPLGAGFAAEMVGLHLDGRCFGGGARRAEEGCCYVGGLGESACGGREQGSWNFDGGDVVPGVGTVYRGIHM